MSRELFEGMLKEADIPISEADMETRWKQINEAQGSLITNDSKWSPFWRLIQAIVTTPCKWLVDLLVITALPNLFMKYASGQWLDVLVWAVNIKRKPETKAVGSIPFTRETSAGEMTVPAGTVIESPKLDGYIYRVIVTADTTIPDGMLVASVPVEAEKPGISN